ncbi:unnamed protein product [Rotaria sordida]|uniref:Uncharacterized protein n=1 Tax=Rotaria sordida TaxID=392033 RepID=A0A819P6P0_9BILA|nr:unnamed protein product [Rotaria sordida]CAF1334032.1 unnamed protein product [Rotaria sordida]CAF4008133.1 unnamed protein product [Rotaria sordida]CAF4135558.1 unnamed protein product [Rotaria sordida]
MSSYLQSTNQDNIPVWIDQDETFDTSMNEKYEIIDECEYILLSFYGFERQYQIIPIMLTSSYRPDG